MQKHRCPSSHADGPVRLEGRRQGGGVWEAVEMGSQRDRNGPHRAVCVSAWEKRGSREVGSKGGAHLALSISEITGSSDSDGWELGSPEPV